MDSRCPRKLEDYPDKWCSLAVLRLKALRQAGKELSEEEEAKCPGCQWAIAHQLSSYCFFKYAKYHLDGKAVSDVEIASLNSISVDTVKKVEKKALNTVKESDMIQRIKESYDGGDVLDNVREVDIKHSIIV